MSVPFRNRIQRYIREDASNMFSINAFRLALTRGLKSILPTLDPSFFPIPATKSTSIFAVAAGDETTLIDVSDIGVDLVQYIAPKDMTIKEISASLSIPQVSGSPTIADVLLNGTSIMTTNKLLFGNGDHSTITSPSKPVLTTTALTAGDLLSVRVTQFGDGTSAGLKVYLVVEI